MNDVEKILELIRITRKEKKITQEELAKQLGISRAMYSHYENNASKMTLDLFFKIIKVLELDIFNVPNPVSKQEIEELMTLISKLHKKVS